MEAQWGIDPSCEGSGLSSGNDPVVVSLILDSIHYARCVYSFIPPDASATCDKIVDITLYCCKIFSFQYWRAVDTMA
jgi:hypothetical protein